MKLQGTTARFHPAVVWRTSDHVAWVLIQHVLVKGFFAAKFLLAARLLGPEQFGLVGVALAALAIVESLSDTGMSQAVVQRKGELTDREAGAVWTLQLARGLILLAVLYAFSTPIASLFGIEAASVLIAIAAFVPIIRNAVHPGYLLVQRNRQFRALAATESAVALVDFLITLGAILEGYGPASLLYGTLAAESVRLFATWTRFKIPIIPNVAWAKISDLGHYGKWIWATSALTVVLNQFDKVIVARLLGAASFGLYQTGARLAQLAISDVAVALGQYFFPTMAKLHNSGGDAWRYFIGALKRMAVFSGCLAGLLIGLSPLITEVILGKEWKGMTGLLQIQSVSMWIGALIAVCVPHLRAIGAPDAITRATLVQLVVLVAPAHFVLTGWGAQGMAMLVAIALLCALLVMFRAAIQQRSS